MSRIIFLFVLFLFVAPCNAQEAAIYNINKYNGLSSNHVYCTLVDQYGYLWMGTTDGVFRYNGFSLEKYDYADGLPNTDVWSLYEDKKGRIWLGSIAQQIGYIKDHSYKRVYKSTNSAIKEIYPAAFRERGDKIIFANVTASKKGSNEIGIIKNDTLTENILLLHSDSNRVAIYLLFDNYAVELVDSSAYLFDIDELLKTPGGKFPKPLKITHHNYDIQSGMPAPIDLLDKYYIRYQPLDSIIIIYNIHNGTTIKLKPPAMTGKAPKLAFCFASKGKLNIITDKGLLTVDSNLNIPYQQSFDSLFRNKNFEGYSNTYFINDVSWGTVISTIDKGLFIKYPDKPAFEKTDIDLGNYGYINRITDSTGYWWNNNENILSVAYRDRIISSVHLPDIYKVKKIIPYNDEKSLLINQTQTRWLYNNNTLQPITEGINNLTINSSHVASWFNSNYFHYLVDCLVVDTNLMYILGSSMMGSYRLSFDRKEKTMHVNNFDFNRYRSIAYNRKHDIVICYSNDKVLLLNTRNDKKIFLDQKQLELMDIRGIENIIIDNFGNIIIKDYSRLHIYNMHSGKMKTHFNGFKLGQALMDIQNNVLSIAGSFGIIQCNVGEGGKISNTITYPNIKNTYYRHVSDAQFAGKYILLKTDNGVFIVNTTRPPDSISSYNEFKIIITNNNRLHKLKINDTVSISQTLATLAIDVIKPTGTGNLNIEYSINGAEYINSGYQLIIPQLAAGSYNTVSVIASDDSWKSKPVKFIIYMQPEWWQTSTAKQIIFTLAILSIIGLIYIIVIVTRRIVNSNNERRTQRRELELKSIYSQINPHFIFNSLSTAQYFVKKNKNKEAFEHINQFSDLLRSYIKSSRNKYITIDEEIENLENYLHLQLTRFEEKFDYSIRVDESVDSKTVKIPSLLLQPIVENALNHGIFHSETKGLLNISFTINKDNKNELICVVDDNGIGRKKSRELRSEQIRKADSYGTILIKELVDTFNKYEKIQIEIEYIDKIEPDSGTTVIIRINNFTHAR